MSGSIAFIDFEISTEDKKILDISAIRHLLLPIQLSFFISSFFQNMTFVGKKKKE